MRRLFILLTIVLFIPYGFCINDTMDLHQTPNVSLNPQGVPVFYDNNPLTGLKAFTVITSFPLKDTDMQKKIGQSVEKALNGIGEVVYLKDNDMQGFGAGNILLIQIGNIAGWDGSEMPISRISLSIESPTTLDKTGVKTFPMVWSIDTFLKENIDSSSESNLTRAIQNLVGDFVQSYQYANKDQTKKPVFYVYD
jgi:hypothetical protein